MPRRPTIVPPVGKSGPGISRISSFSFCSGVSFGRIGRRQQGLLDEPDGAVDHLAQVVRRDVRGHADGDAGRAVDEQVGVDASGTPSVRSVVSSKFGTKSTVSLSRSSIIASASASSRASV